MPTPTPTPTPRRRGPKPQGTAPRNSSLNVAVSQTERLEVGALATRAGVTASTWGRRALLALVRLAAAAGPVGGVLPAVPCQGRRVAVHLDGATVEADCATCPLLTAAVQALEVNP